MTNGQQLNRKAPMSQINNLSPSGVWKIFNEITSIPRPSKKEGKIMEYLINFAVSHGLEYKKDEVGNIVIRKPASPSMSDRPVVILQSHTDMVCEKNSGVEFNFDTDPIRTRITDDGWVCAEGTTLGADDGIGMAAALALLIEKDLELPPIEALFTVDEETGMTGAFNLGTDMITGKYFINLDSEDEGEIFIGCAGGIDTVAVFSYDTEPAPSGHVFFRINISGLKGGHSGDDIDKGLGNSNRLLVRFLWHGIREASLKLCGIDGGNLRNAIPREASAVFAIPLADVEKMFGIIKRQENEILAEYHHTEPGIDISVSEVEPQSRVIDGRTARNLIYAVQGVPNGVLSMSSAMKGLVETSSNLASVKMSDGNKITVTTSQRSSVDGARFNAAAAVESVFELAGASVKHSDGYPGWNPDPSSPLLKVTRESYVGLFGKEPVVRAVHAGLECGLFLQKYPRLDMVSIGPTIRGVHSPDEKLEIATVDKFWKLLIATVQNIRS